MTLLHFRYRQRLGLLAAGALGPQEADWVRTHTTHCAACQMELAQLLSLASHLVADAALDRPLPISSEALRTRVLARIRTTSPHQASRQNWSLTPIMGALGLVAMGLAAGLLATRVSAPQREALSVPTSLEGPGETSLNDIAFYERLEKTHVRANAVRYLAEAQDILIQVTAAADCPDSPRDSVDVRREAQTSRSLLKRRAALVSDSEGTLVAAQGVMEEVEGVLQQVAELPHCTRRTDVDAIARKVDRKHLLMKIDLVSQELAAP